MKGELPEGQTLKGLEPRVMIRVEFGSHQISPGTAQRWI